MTGIPDEFTRKIDVLGMVSAAGAEGMLTLVLGEQLCCPACCRSSTRWEVPAAEPVTKQLPRDVGGRPDPGE